MHKAFLEHDIVITNHHDRHLGTPSGLCILIKSLAPREFLEEFIVGKFGFKL
jgi:hypothetical protein